MSDSNRYAKRRNQATHTPANLYVPSNATTNGSIYAPQQYHPQQQQHFHHQQPTVPSSGRGYYNPEQFAGNLDQKSPYHFQVVNTAPAQPVVPPVPNGFTNDPAPLYQSTYLVPSSTYTQTMPLITPNNQYNEHEQVMSFTNYGGYPAAAASQYASTSADDGNMPLDFGDSSRAATTPPMSPGSLPDNSASEKAPRDPHRKEIEARAAAKRKAAHKRLQHVLAARSGLPENGNANQINMAADQLEEDGKTILALKKENIALKKENAALKRENADLRSRGGGGSHARS